MAQEESATFSQHEVRVVIVVGVVVAILLTHLEVTIDVISSFLRDELDALTPWQAKLLLYIASSFTVDFVDFGALISNYNYRIGAYIVEHRYTLNIELLLEEWFNSHFFPPPPILVVRVPLIVLDQCQQILCLNWILDVHCAFLLVLDYCFAALYLVVLCLTVEACF